VVKANSPPIHPAPARRRAPPADLPAAANQPALQARVAPCRAQLEPRTSPATGPTSWCRRSRCRTRYRTRTRAATGRSAESGVAGLVVIGLSRRWTGVDAQMTRAGDAAVTPGTAPPVARTRPAGGGSIRAGRAGLGWAGLRAGRVQVPRPAPGRRRQPRRRLPARRRPDCPPGRPRGRQPLPGPRRDAAARSAAMASAPFPPALPPRRNSAEASAAAGVLTTGADGGRRLLATGLAVLPAQYARVTTIQYNIAGRTATS